MTDLEITQRIILFFALLLTYCSVSAIRPAENDILGIKFSGPDQKKWRFGIGLFQVICAGAFYAWIGYHAHTNLETIESSWVIREGPYLVIVIVCISSIVTGIINLIRGMDTQRLGHL
jgi:hypothetical protein